MVPGDGRLPATKIRDHVVGRVEKFGLCFKTDVINGTNDGCKTMIKYGKEIKKRLQLCLAHGTQLSVVKVNYIKKKKPKKTNAEVEPEKASDTFAGSDEEIDDDDDQVTIYSDVEEEDQMLASDDDQDNESDEDEEDLTGLIEEAPNPQQSLPLKGMYMDLNLDSNN